MFYLLIALPVLLAGFAVSELIEDNNDEKSPDRLVGGDGTDNLDGLSGNDTILGGGGNDNIEGGSGEDSLVGGTGNDVIEGEQGEDTIEGGSGNDFIQSGRDEDVTSGGAGNDWIEGNAGNDQLTGNEGRDILIGGSGADQIDGGADDDLLLGGDINGLPLRFEELKDFRDGSTLDSLLPGDRVQITDDSSADTLVGGAGEDQIILGAADIATGGDASDFFALLEGRATGQVSTITDYGPTDEIVLIGANSSTTPTITVTTAGADAIVSADGVELARVIGAAGSLSASNISVVDPATLLQSDLEPIRS